MKGTTSKVGDSKLAMMTGKLTKANVHERFYPITSISIQNSLLAAKTLHQWMFSNAFNY
jgi:hypothetical protein